MRTCHCFTITVDGSFQLFLSMSVETGRGGKRGFRQGYKKVGAPENTIL
jgi:hypothetical protein